MEPYLPERLPLARHIDYLPERLPLARHIDWKRHVSLIAEANRLLARFDQVLAGIPHPDFLLAPVTTQEAVLSSKIEGTQATLEEVLAFDAEPSEQAKHYHDIQEVNNYRETLRFAMDSLSHGPFTLNLIREMHRILLDGVRGTSKKRGEFRTTQNWIGRPGATIERATFVPPSPINLPDHLSNFEKYFHHQDTESLVQLAIVHAQFELLHPFLDGNGRIGRILIPIFLYEKKLISHPSYYISRYFDEERKAYYDHLEGISKRGAWDDWIEFFLLAITSQATAQTVVVEKLLKFYHDTKISLAQLMKSHSIESVVDFLFCHPIFKGPRFIQATQLPRATGSRLLSGLKNAGVLQPVRETKGRAGQVYRVQKLLQIFEQ